MLEAIEDPDSRFFVEFMLQTGMRIGESSAQKPDHHEIVQFPVRQPDGSIEIEERVQVIVLEAFERHAGKGVGTPLGSPKTRKGTRSITLSKKFGKRFLQYIAKKSRDSSCLLGQELTCQYRPRGSRTTFEIRRLIRW